MPRSNCAEQPVIYCEIVHPWWLLSYILHPPQGQKATKPAFLKLATGRKFPPKKHESKSKKAGFPLCVPLKSAKSPLKHSARDEKGDFALRFKGDFADFNGKHNGKLAFFILTHFFLFLKLSPGGQVKNTGFVAF